MRFFLLVAPAVHGLVEASTIALLVVRIAVVVCRRASRMTRPRTLPATALAPLSHMLKNGFFFSQGFRTQSPTFGADH